MSPRVFLLLFTIACVQVMAKPVRKKLNFNMFVLHPRQDVPEPSDSITKFGPILEYFTKSLHRLFIKKPQELPTNTTTNTPVSIGNVPMADAADNELDAEVRPQEFIIRPSLKNPGTYEVELDVEIEDGQPEDKTD